MTKTNKAVVDAETLGRLRLCYAEVATEFKFFEPLTARRLTAESVEILRRWLAKLLDTASRKSRDSIIIKTLKPLSTMANDGKHQTASGVSLLGEIEIRWDVTPEVLPGKRAATHFLLDNASIRLAICELDKAGERHVIARWTFDVGDRESPGCHFHAKYECAIAGSGSNIDIPRLPALVIMPTDAMAFLFGELWQKQWSVDLETDLRDHAIQWRSWPRHRLAAVLAAFAMCIRDDHCLIPWAAFKAYKPRGNLLLK